MAVPVLPRSCQDAPHLGISNEPERARKDAHEPEASREHTDDGVRRTIQDQRLSDDVPAASEPALPQPKGDDDHLRLGLRFFLWQEVATDSRIDAQRAEQVPGGGRSVDRPGIPGTGNGHRLWRRVEGSQVVERATGLAVVEVVEPRHETGAGTVARRPADDEAVRFAVRDSAEERRARHTEHRCGGADAERERDRHGECERRLATKASHAQANVLQECVERGAGPGRPQAFLVLLDAAELQPCAPACLLGIEAAAHEVLDAGLEVELQFVGQLALKAIAAEQAPQEDADNYEHSIPHGGVRMPSEAESSLLAKHRRDVHAAGAPRWNQTAQQPGSEHDREDDRENARVDGHDAVEHAAQSPPHRHGTREAQHDSHDDQHRAPACHLAHDA